MVSRMVVSWSETTRGCAVMRLFSVSLPHRQNMCCGSTTVVDRGVDVRARGLDRGVATADPQIHTPSSSSDSALSLTVLPFSNVRPDTSALTFSAALSRASPLSETFPEGSSPWVRPISSWSPPLGWSAPRPHVEIRAYRSIHGRYTTTVATRGVAVLRLYSTYCLNRQNMCYGSTTPGGRGRRRARTSKYARIYIENPDNRFADSSHPRGRCHAIMSA